MATATEVMLMSTTTSKPVAYMQGDVIYFFGTLLLTPAGLIANIVCMWVFFSSAGLWRKPPGALLALTFLIDSVALIADFLTFLNTPAYDHVFHKDFLHTDSGRCQGVYWVLFLCEFSRICILFYATAERYRSISQGKPTEATVAQFKSLVIILTSVFVATTVFFTMDTFEDAETGEVRCAYTSGKNFTITMLIERGGVLLIPAALVALYCAFTTNNAESKGSIDILHFLFVKLIMCLVFCVPLSILQFFEENETYADASPAVRHALYTGMKIAKLMVTLNRVNNFLICVLSSRPFAQSFAVFMRCEKCCGKSGTVRPNAPRGCCARLWFVLTCGFRRVAPATVSAVSVVTNLESNVVEVPVPTPPPRPPKRQTSDETVIEGVWTNSLQCSMILESLSTHNSPAAEQSVKDIAPVHTSASVTMENECLATAKSPTPTLAVPDQVPSTPTPTPTNTLTSTPTPAIPIPSKATGATLSPSSASNPAPTPSIEIVPCASMEVVSPKAGTAASPKSVSDYVMVAPGSYKAASSAPTDSNMVAPEADKVATGSYQAASSAPSNMVPGFSKIAPAAIMPPVGSMYGSESETASGGSDSTSDTGASDTEVEVAGADFV